MSEKALWAPRHLETWNWREAAHEEQQPQGWAFETWSRPDSDGTGSVPGEEEDSSRVGAPLVSAWIGFTVAGLAAFSLALSMLYSQLETALTGVTISPGLPIVVLAVSAASGLLLGVTGLVLAKRRGRRGETRRRLNEEPDTPIAA